MTLRGPKRSRYCPFKDSGDDKVWFLEPPWCTHGVCNDSARMHGKYRLGSEKLKGGVFTGLWTPK